MKAHVAKAAKELATANEETVRLQKMYESVEAEKHAVQNQVR